MADLLSRYVGSMLGLAVGDALGMPTESKSRQEIKEKFGLVTTYTEGYLPKGYYTDDTQQTLILAKSLLEEGGFDKERYVHKLLQETDPERGIGPGLSRFISAKKVDPDYRCQPVFPSNGLAMKIAPVSLFFRKRPEQIYRVIEELSQITHPHPGSLAGAVAVASAVLYALETPPDRFDPKHFLHSIITQVGRYHPLMAEMLAGGAVPEDNTSSSYSTVPHSILEFIGNPPQYQEGIISLVNSGGDTDTKASMFGALSGAYNGIEAIPSEWVKGLEDGAEGRHYILSLAEKLYAASERR